MTQFERFGEIIATYRKHGWRLARVLMRQETRAKISGPAEALFGDIAVEESSVDALWLTRPSSGGREAWELRLVADTPYALFETFEADEAEEDREEVRTEMLARLREHAGERDQSS